MRQKALDVNVAWAYWDWSNVHVPFKIADDLDLVLVMGYAAEIYSPEYTGRYHMCPSDGRKLLRLIRKGE